MDQKHMVLNRRSLVGLGVAALAGSLGLYFDRARGQESFSPPAKRNRFRNKVVLVTGATSGIGRAAAIQFADEGAKVGFCGRRMKLGKDVEREILSRGGEATYVRADVRIENDVKSFIDQIYDKYHGLDIAFNNAGITIERPLHELTCAEWDDIQLTNLRGVFLAMKYEIPHMLAAGKGCIVVTSSSNAIGTEEKRSAYTASKRGLVGLVQAAALDYAQHGIRINALLPGTTDTALVRRVAHMEGVPDSVWEAAAADWGKSHVPVGRMATAAEIADFAVALASDEYPYMTGGQMVIDGGKTARSG